ncbi:MAG: P-loop NTPase fold protein [Candidatus Aminicenantes bacterium]|nr:P-loop NTPase fold protein [Candidatus Aminicenantes bacterium]
MMKNDDRCELFKKIALTALVAIISVTLVFPLLLKLQLITGFFKNDSIELFIGITAIILAIFIMSRKRMSLYWKRYKATKETGNFPLVSVEIIGLYFIITEVLSIFKLCFIPRKDIIPSIQFTAFSVINGVLFLIWFFKSFYYKEKPSEQIIVNEASDIDLDEPITSPDQDRLRRGKFVKDLYKLILKKPLRVTGSFTMGLNGSWGEGKTSVINLLIAKLLKSPCFKRNYLLIQFDPWCFGDETAILNAFYDKLEKAFSTKFIFPDIKKSIARYLRIISTGLSFSWFKIDIHSPILTIEKTKEQIGNYIQKSGKKVLIIIDDIDRLQPYEMALVFKLVRQNSNFKNTIFLLSFDLSIVKKALKENCDIDGDFLEKIITMPIPLPTIEPRSIEGYLLDEIKKVLNKIAIPGDEAKSLLDEFQGIYKSGITELFKTLRVTKRYLNSLKTTLPSIKSEVNPRDFLILEIIKVFNDDLFNKLSKHQWSFAPTFIEQLSLEADDAIETRFKNQSPYKNRGDFMMASLRKLIDSLLISTNDREKEIFQKLLTHLFPETIGKVLTNQQPNLSSIQKDRNKKKISHPECFPKYFLFQVPSLEIPDEQLETMISIWQLMPSEDRKAYIRQVLFEKDNEGNAWTSRWIQKLMDFNEQIDSPSLAQSIIEVIYENADAFSRGQTFYPFSEFTKAAQLMILLIFGKTEKQSIPEVFEDALMKTPDLLFSTVIIREYKNKEEMGKPMSSIYSIDLKPFQDKVAQRLNKYFVDNKRDIFEIYNEPAEWDFILALWGTEWKSWDGQFSEIVQDYVLSLLKDDAEKFYKFLCKMVVQFQSLNISKSKVDDFKRYYDVTKFKEIALKFKDSDILSPEKKNLINKFLESVPQDQPQLSQE